MGTIDNLKVFIPISETHIASNYFDYKIGKVYDTIIKCVADDGRSLIATFKPFIKHPLSIFEENYREGNYLRNFIVYRVEKCLYLIKLNNKKFNNCRLCLHVSEVSNIAFIDKFEKISPMIKIAPLTIKTINYERNCVELSLKSVFLTNNDKRNNLDYKTTYKGVVIGTKDLRYVIVILNHWIEGYMVISKIHCVGEEVSVHLATYGSEYAEFYEE